MKDSLLCVTDSVTGTDVRIVGYFRPEANGAPLHLMLRHVEPC